MSVATAYKTMEIATLRRKSVPVPVPQQSAIERVMELAIATVLAVVLAPFMLLIAILVRLDSPGPIIYSQMRVGQNRRVRREEDFPEEATARLPIVAFRNRKSDAGGRMFRVYKFRSMHVNAESNGQAVWCAENDPRVTRVGRILRKTHLDELPQLWNIFRGDMSIVGPRPERPAIVRDLIERIPHYERRLSVKPGVTGLAQTRHRADVEISDVRRKLRYDIFYLKRRSIRFNAGIIAATVPCALGWNAKGLRRFMRNFRFN